MSSNNTNGQSANLEADIAQIRSFLSQEPSEGDSDSNLAELLRKMDAADGMAKGVESKLDNMLENLDQLLASLEPEAKDDAKKSD